VSRWIRWIGYGLLGLFGLVALALAGLYLVTSLRFRRTHAIPDSPVRAAADSAALARGRHLVEAIGKCQECHGADFGGRVMMDSPVFARLAAANLTTGRGGIAGYTDADYERAIRHGVGRNGRTLFFMPAEAFEVMSDDDLAAVIGYLRTLPAVDRENPAPRIGPVARMLYLGGNFPLLPAERVSHQAPPPAPAPADTVAYGTYLATLGGCRACHGAGLAGTGDPAAPDLTRKLAGWSEADFFRALREGRRPDGTVIDPTKMPWVRSGQMADEEIRAVWGYVRSLPEGPES
jgi:mono/diheme cytochrome c family protein